MDSWESLEGGWNSDFSQQWDFVNDGLEPDIEYHTVIDGGNNGRCVTLESTGDTNRISGFTIQNGVADHGGGMSNVRSSPTVSHCRFYDNRAVSDGAGMYNLNSSPAISDCAFSENVVTGTMSHGGGMYNAFSSPNITNCDFSKNQSGGWGAGMYNYYSPSKISNCTFSQNNAGKTGGGMVNSHGNTPPIISNCIFSENTAVSGGGMRNTWCEPIVTNCLFWGNTATIEGGGIFNLFDSPIITNCTFSQNNSGKGGAISHQGQDNQPYAPIITNCILWGNTGGEIYIDAYSFPIVTYCNIDQDGYAGQNGNMRANPLFVDPQNDNYHLTATSQCVNAGNNDAPAIPDTDKDGNPRIIYGTVDMGAYEYQVLLPSITVTSPNGGEELTAGTTHEITWTSEGNIDNVKIEYSVNNGTDWIEIIDSTENDGFYIWDVPFELSDACLIRISDVDGDAYDESDAVLSILPPWYVDGDIAVSGNGASWSEAFKTIQEAIDAADDGDVIWVKQGTYFVTSTIDVYKSVFIYGGFDGTETNKKERNWRTNVTIVDGRNTVSCFYIPADAVLDGFTIAHGHTHWGGGGCTLKAVHRW
jgi:hypothetical protein